MLIPFYISEKHNFILDFEHECIRFFSHYGEVLTSGGDIYEVETPYKHDEIKDIRYIQNGDILYLFHKNHPIKTLTRYADNNWILSTFELRNGPWENVNTSDTTMIASASTGTITITSSANVFKSTDVGRLVRLTVLDISAKPWTASTSFVINQVVTSDGHYYQALSAGTSGNVKPVHTEGSKTDGVIQWKYLHSGYGTARITAFTDAKNVTAAVQDYIPEEVTTTATAYWELGLIHAGSEYPVCGAFFRNRFCFMVTSNYIPKVCMSCSDDYDNFADKDFGEVQATNAITVPVINDKYNIPSWLCASDVLFVGTSSGEYYIDSSSASAAMAPDNVKIQPISEIGSKPIQPVKIGSHVLFVTSSGTSIRDIIYSFNTDSYDPIDLSLFGRHLLASGIMDMVYQEYPDKVIWFTVGDGRLIGMTFSSEQQVAALHQHNVSGDVTSMTVIPSYDYNIEDLWFIVKRKINNLDFESIEYLDNGYPVEYTADINNIDNVDEKEYREARYLNDNAFYIDSGVIVNRNPYKGIKGNVYCLSDTFYGRTATLFDENNNFVSVQKAITSLDNDLPYETTIYKSDKASYSAQVPVTSGDGTSYTIGFDSSLIGLRLTVYQFTTLHSGSRIAKRLYDGVITGSNVTFAQEVELLQTADSIKMTITENVSSENVDVGGLDHLEGKEVAIMIDGAAAPNQTVTEGKISIPNKSYVIKVGLPIVSAYIPQNIYIQGNNGSGVGDVQRIDHVTLMLWRSMGGKIGKDFNSLQDIYFRHTDEKMDNPTPLYTGNKEIPVDMRTSFIKEKGASVLIYNDSVFPMNILAIVPHFTTSGNGK